MGPEIAYVALGLSIVCNGILALGVYRSLPAAIVRDHRIIRTEIERVHDSVEGLQTRWASKVIELTSLAEECAGYMERAEKKRRQTAGAMAKMGAVDATPDPTSREGLIQMAHRSGLM